MGTEYTFEVAITRGLGASRAGVGDLHGPAASITEMMPMPDEDEEDAATLPEITGFTAYDARPDARRLVWEEVTGTSYELRYTADATADDAMWTDWEEQASGVTVYDLDMGMEYTFELRAGIGDLRSVGKHQGNDSECRPRPFRRSRCCSSRCSSWAAVCICSGAGSLAA